MRKVTENEPISRHKGRLIINSNHAIERGHEQRDVDTEKWPYHLFEKEIIRIIKQGIDKIFNVYDDSSSVYLIHSRSTHFGVVVNWRQQNNPQYDDGRNHSIIVTVLPPRKNHYTKNSSDILLTVEVIKDIERYYGKKTLNEKARQQEYNRFMTDYGFTAHVFEGEITNIDAPILFVS